MLIIFALFMGTLMAFFAYHGWAMPQSPKHAAARLFAALSFMVALFASIEAGKAGTFVMMAQTLGSLALLIKFQLESWEI